MVQLHFDELWGEQNRARLRVVGLYKALNRVRGMSLANATQKEAIVSEYEQAFARAFEGAQDLGVEGSLLSVQLDALRGEYNRIRDFA